MRLISRGDAEKSGLKRFYTGIPCPNNHLSERYVKNGQCIQCRAKHYDPVKSKEYNAEYRKANREELIEYDRMRSVRDADKIKEHSLRYYWENREEILSKSAAYRAANQEKIKSRVAAYARSNHEAIRERARELNSLYPEKNRGRVKEWRKQNPGKRLAQHAKRRAAKAKAVPAWYGELDDFVWQEAADLARRRFEATGIKWEVDHMIPLAGRKALGLHVAGNCQVIPAIMNNEKKNKMILTERLEWLK